MEPIFEEITTVNGDVTIKKTVGENVYWIPVNESNRDYQEYIAWLEGDK
jgi:hypothetical protein